MALNNPSCLLTFARDNEAEMIADAVKLGVPVDWANGIGQTALHVAALWGNLEAAETLLDLGIDVNVRNSRGTTPLHFAAGAHKNAEDICNLLLDRGADLDAMDQSGRLPYEMAKLDEIRTLLGGPDPRLFDCAADGNLEGLRAVFAEDPELEPAPFNQQGTAPVHLAAGRGHLGVVNFLLERGTAVDMQDWLGNSAAHHAVREGHEALLKLLIRRGADLSLQNFHNSNYAQGGWLSKGEALGPLHQTPLHIAVEAGDVAAAELLLAAGAPVGTLDFDKKAPLHLALEMQDEELCELLIGHGADINQGCQDFASPLHLAAARGMARVLQLLVAKGAIVQAADAAGWTPLMLAVRGGKLDAVRSLLKAGANAEAANAQGSTAVHLAAVNGKAEVCRLLAEQCPQALGVRNGAGALPTDVAKTPEIAAILAPQGSCNGGAS